MEVEINEKYKQLAGLFLEKLIRVEKDIQNTSQELEKNSKKHEIKIYLKSGNIIPLLEFAEIVELRDDDEGSKMYDEIEKLSNCDDGLKSHVEKFLEKYVEVN